MPAVARVVVVFELAHFRENLGEPLGRAARRVLFQAVMHLDDFEIEAGPRISAALRVSQKSVFTPTL